MEKAELLGFLNARAQADAFEVAKALGESYPTAAMALLRAVRQGLVERLQDPRSDSYWYRLSARGQARLAYLQTTIDQLRRQ